MKQKDLAVIGGVMILSVIVSLIIATKFVNTPNNRQQKVTTVGAISSSFPIPGTAYFNTSSVDPAQSIQVNNQQNTNPFGNSPNQ